MVPKGSDDQVHARQALRQVFPGCDDPSIDAALQQLHWQQLSAGDVLLQLEAPGDSAYLLLRGSLKVYSRSNNNLVPIATLNTPGQLFGEQALLPGHQYRNAYVIALEDCLLAELSLQTFQALLKADPQSRARLEQKGRHELRDRLKKLGIGLENSVLEAADNSSKQLSAGQVLLPAGRVPSSAYSLVAGQLSMRPANGGRPVLILGPGSLVGVQELIGQRPCRLEAVADSAVEVLSISHERLQQLPGSEEFSTSLQALVELPGLGRVYRSRQIQNGEPAVISDYSGLPGGPLRVLQMPNRRRIEATRSLANADTRHWQSPDKKNELLVEASSGRLLGLAMDQNWPRLSDLMGVLLRDIPLTAMQLQAFSASGQLLLEAPEEQIEGGSHMICACTGTTSTALREAAQHSDTLAGLQQLTAAGTVCGGCLHRLPSFLNQAIEVRLCRLSLHSLASGSMTVRLKPIEAEPLPPWRVGEHLVVEVLIDGRWVSRQYTLTNGDSEHYELGIKREENGIVSGWLAQAGPSDLVRISPPQGNLLPAPDDERPLLYLVAGIGVTPAIAGVRRLSEQRQVTVAYSFRGEDNAAYLSELREAASAGRIVLHEHDSSLKGRSQFQQSLDTLAEGLDRPTEIVVCGPDRFNLNCQALLSRLPMAEVRVESFRTPAIDAQAPGAWRLKPDVLAERVKTAEQPFGTCPRPVPVDESCPMDEARSFLDSYRREVEPTFPLEARLHEVAAEWRETGQWQLTHAELGFGARLAWRQAERCVGRLYWKGLELFDRRDLSSADDIADALFEHLRFAFNGGDLRPAISVFNPGTPGRTAPRLWNPQLLRYAGYRSSSGRQIGDPAQNALTAKLIQLGWQPSGEAFELLPLVIQTPDDGPRLFPLPDDCRQEVLIRHPDHAWIDNLNLRWYAVPAVSDMALDVGGNLFRLAPFNGWYLDTEIAARNLSDQNRFNMLPQVAAGLGLDLRDDRNLWRDHAQLVLAEAVLYSFDQAGVRLADHHAIGHEFLEFCRSEQELGRDPQAEWSWVVPPMSGSLNVLYQEPFNNRAFKPAYVPQPPIWEQPQQRGSQGTTQRCPFSMD